MVSGPSPLPPPTRPPIRAGSPALAWKVCVCVGGLPFAPFSVHGPPLQQLARSAKPHLILLTALGFPRWLGGRMGGGGVPSAAGPGSCTGAEGSASFGAVDSPGSCLDRRRKTFTTKAVNRAAVPYNITHPPPRCCFEVLRKHRRTMCVCFPKTTDLKSSATPGGEGMCDIAVRA